MDNIILYYSTGCSKCKVLKTKLGNKGLNYTEVNDIDIMKQLGISSVPVLGVNGELLKFKEANDYINTIRTEE